MAYNGSLQAPKGTRDFFPEDMRLQNHIFAGWRQVCTRFGFEEYEGPTFEGLELYTGKSGNEIVSQLYHFTDKGDRQLALRPELTPTLARMVNQKGPALKLPVKWFSMPRLYRYEKAQRGRLREFFQLNMDVVGCESLWAEIDLLSAIIAMLKTFGLTQADFRIRVSNRRLLSEVLDLLGILEADKPPVYAALDKREKIPAEAFHQLLQQAGLNPTAVSELESVFTCTDFESLKKALLQVCMDQNANLQGLTDLQWLFAQMDALGLGDFLTLDLSVVRGLAYYTGIVFEVYDAAKSLRALAGGGRYDNLLENLGGRALTGVGFGMGDVVLAELLREKNLIPGEAGRLDAFVVTFGEASTEAFQVAQALRDKGISATCSITGGKLKKQMAQADEAGARQVVFVGSDRVESGKYEVKDLKTGEQRICTLAEIV